LARRRADVAHQAALPSKSKGWRLWLLTAAPILGKHSPVWTFSKSFPLEVHLVLRASPPYVEGCLKGRGRHCRNS
jgi:hypothetical protein